MSKKIAKSVLSLTITMGLMLGCSKDEDELRFVACNVIVGFKQEVTLREAFDFATANANDIGYVHGLFYFSNLPNDSLNYVAQAVVKAGFSDKVVRIGLVSNRIEIIMGYNIDEDKSTISNWIDLIENPVLKIEAMQNHKSMLLYIEPGTEKQWVKTHESNTLIRYIELDYYF